MATETSIVIDGITVTYGGSTPDAKRKTVSFKVSEEELRTIDEAARRLGKSRSEFIREAAIEMAAVILSIPKSRENDKTPELQSP